jgi:hypothetical protein
MIGDITMFLVINHESGRDVAIDSDGVRHADLYNGELFRTEQAAAAVASRYPGAQIADADRVCPTDYGDDDE